MLTFLFWNVNGDVHLGGLAGLVAQQDVDVVILAECEAPPADTLRALNDLGRGTFRQHEGVCTALKIYSRLPGDPARPIYEEPRLTVRHLRVPHRADILLAVVHLRSKLFQAPESQHFASAELARSIDAVEQRAGHRRTIVVGDFNMNPFEPGMVAAAGLNAVMDRSIAARGERTVDGRRYPFFYNPMWSLMGDGPPGPPGTFYRDRGDQVTYFWNTLDQVLIRPELLSCFRTEDLQVPTSDGARDLVVLSRRQAGAHLPLLFRLNV